MYLARQKPDSRCGGLKNVVLPGTPEQSHSPGLFLSPDLYLPTAPQMAGASAAGTSLLLGLPRLYEQELSPGFCGCQEPSMGPVRARATLALTCAGEKLTACLMAVSHCQGHRLPSPLSQRRGKNQRIDLKEEVLRVPAELAVPSAGPRPQVTLQRALPKAPAQHCQASAFTEEGQSPKGLEKRLGNQLFGA